jgi:diguanylate cyclase (GGDEF)-like protein
MIVSMSMFVTAILGYTKLYQVTEQNSSIRIDRAARAATAIFTGQLNEEFLAILASDGRPLAIRLVSDTSDTSLSFRKEYDDLLKIIGLVNQGAANLFRLNPQTSAFDRFATTFRMPDESMPPPISIEQGHPAYNNIFNNRPHLGEVPVMGRMRLAYLIPLQITQGEVAGALAVDVGWVDDLITARKELQFEIIVATVIILGLLTAFGVIRISKELKPLRELAKFADDLADETASNGVPFKSREDEIGALAKGLERVVSLQGKLAFLAYKDELTGLGNRSRYLDDLGACLKEGLADKHHSALMHLDIDGFKIINDAFGQNSGDALLKVIADQLIEIVGKESKIARLSSDQFTILMAGASSEAQVAETSKIILERLSELLQLDGIEVRLTASIGVLMLQRTYKNIDEVHRNAGIALSRAKVQGGDQAVFFSQEMDDKMQEDIRLDRLLRAAIKNREIELHFQPQIFPSSNMLAGVEALARWTDSVEGSISPGKFIPHAEASGQIVDLGTLVLDLACAQAAKWKQEKFDFKHISVNVSPMQLWQSNFVDILKTTLARHNVPGQSIYIEITEGVFVGSERRVSKVIEDIRSLGLKLSLDDFGTGYSSLGYLNRLPIDQLKIDRRFVSNVDTDERKREILRGILELGRSLNLDIVIEGAETQGELKAIEAYNRISVQGYYYARPASAVEIPDIVNAIAQFPLL